MNVEYIEVGRVCVSRAGHDKGSFYVIVSIVDENYVMLADGRKKTSGNPKKKKIKHLRTTPRLLGEIAGKISEGKKVHDHEIAKALDEINEDSKKGKEG